MKAGMAISPDTPSSAVTDEIAKAADMILVMTVYPGESEIHHLLRHGCLRCRQVERRLEDPPRKKRTNDNERRGSSLLSHHPSTHLPSFVSSFTGRGGQKFKPECLPKVTELRARFPSMDIQVDGGVGPSTIHVCASAGSNVIVAGSAIFGAPDSKKVISELRAVVDEALKKAGGEA